MTDKINVLVTLDENYLPHLKVTLHSLWQNNQNRRFVIWLIQDQISASSLAQLRQLTDYYQMELQILTIPENLFADAPTEERYPKEMYYRLACGQILPETVKRVIYLDPDTLIINDILALWTLDLQGKIFAAAQHTGLQNLTGSINNLRLGTTHGYFNSGIMLIDVAVAREKVKLADIYQTLTKYGDYLLLPDQDILNYLYGAEILEIPEELWNYDTRQGSLYFAKSLGKINNQWIAKNTVILHFCGKPKPWQDMSNNRFTMLYLNYQQLVQRLEQQLQHDN